ncbi:major facilitator superfamily domain-containing protein [Cladochytrium replicatum]|nr:major facilitator superfamily domain-containing protein [Cladochytrium replicatum]
MTAETADEIASPEPLRSVEPSRESDHETLKAHHLKSKSPYYPYLMLPFLIALVMGEVVKEAPFKQFLIKLVCDAYLRDKGPEGVLDAPPSNTCSGVPEVQQMLAKIIPVLVYVGFVPSFFLAPLYGWASDKFGRKPIMLFICFGSIVRHICDLLVLSFGLPYNFLLVGRFFAGATGGLMALSSLLSAATIDVTNAETRVKFLGIVQGTVLVSIALAEILGGLLVKITGDFWIPFCLSCIFAIIALVYGILVLQETRVPHDTSDSENSGPPVLELFQLDLRKEIPWLTMLPFLIYWMACESQTSLRTYYTNYRFGWVAWEESLFMAGNTIAAAAAMVVVLPPVDRAFRKRFNLPIESSDASSNAETRPLLETETPQPSYSTAEVDVEDSAINISRPSEKHSQYLMMFSQAAFFGTITTAHAFMFGSANRAWMLFALIPVKAIGSLCNVMESVLIAEAINPDHLGLINTFVLQLDSLVMAFANQIFATIYQGTVTFMPEALFYVGGLVYVVAVIAFIVVPRFKRPLA